MSDATESREQEIVKIAQSAIRESDKWRASPDTSFWGWETNTTQLENALEMIVEKIKEAD